MMRKILLMCYCVALAWSASAQQRNVTGKVTDATDGTGLPGVSVVVKGTTIGTVSDTNGDFSISVNSNDVLSFSFIGFEPQEITVGERTSITLSMTASINELDEVIVIGYGEREKKDITGSISSMGAKDIEKSAYINPEQAMQGKMAGVFVSSPSGAPNARPNVLIRGIGTFNEGTQPLYVIDGVPTFEFGQATEEGLEGDVRGTVNILTLINPGDIESISVLKDAAASAIYGARAANGVVLITTKKGKSGAPKIDFNASAGVQQLSKTYDVLNTQDFVKLYTDMFDADTEYRRQYAPSPNPAAPYSWDVPGQQYLNVFNPNSTDPYYKYLGNSPTYDWQNELQNKNASIQDYSVRISGGNDATTYYIGGGFSKTESPLINNSLKRYSLSTNIQTKISKAIEVGLLYRLSYVNAIDNTSGAIDGASRVSPWQPIYDTNDPTGFARTTDVAFIPNPAFDLTKANSGAAQIQVPGSSQMRPWGNESNFNYFANMALTKRDYALLKNFGNVYLQIQPLKGLKIKGAYSVDYTTNRRNEFNQSVENVRFSETPGNPYENQDGTSKATYNERHTQNVNTLADFTVNYTKTIGDHNFDLLFNGSTQKMKWEFFGGSSPQLYEEYDFRNIGGQNRFNSAQSARDNKAIQGYVGRLSYNYKSKYYLDASLRRDGSTQFAPENRWGTFPGVSAAWRISAEEMFQSNVSFISDLKLRVGYGLLGNTFSSAKDTGFSQFAYVSTVSTTPDYALGSGGGNALGTQLGGAYLPTFPNVNLSWETAKTFNIGFDGLALNNRVNFTIEYYNKLTEGIIQNVRLPSSAGINGVIDYNVGNVRNQGIELQLGYTENVGDVQLSINGNFTTVKNRVTKLYLDRNFPVDGKVVGQSFGYIYGYKTGGIFQTQEEIDAWKLANDDASGANPRPGDMWFQDINSATEAGETVNPGPDSLVDSNDRTFLGKTTPGFYYGVTLGAKYKGFDLTVFFQGIGDVSKYNYARAAGESMSGTGLNMWTSTDGRWTETNPSSSFPRAVYNDPNNNNRFSDRFVENGAFMRLKNVQLGYTVPKNVLNYTKVVNSLRVYFSGTNLFTITKWTGLDPEDPKENMIPPTRIMSLGINASF